MIVDELLAHMDRRGYFKGPNGITYKLIAFGSLDAPAIEKLTPAEPGTANREVIVGNRGELFLDRDAAVFWAIHDATREFANG